MAEEIMQMVKQAGESVAGPGNVDVELVWDPPWSLANMSTAARIELDLTDEGW
jgi:metal-sulfur cluster biosynthetic enzyme